jgi:hypothetical protein
MATSGRWSIDAAPNVIQEAKYEVLLRKIRERHISSFWIAQFEMTQQAPDAAAEVIEGYTNIANNLDCATDLIHVLSSDADDAHDGVGAQAVRIWYLKNSLINYADYDLQGQAHVHLAALGIIDRLIGMQIIASTTAAVPAIVVPQGNIVIDVNATGTVYCTITAGNLYSFTCTMWVPAGYKMIIAQLTTAIVSAPTATGILSTDGVNMYINVNGTVTKGQVIPPFEPVLHMGQPFDLPLDGEGYIALKHDSTHTDTLVTPTHTITYMLWKEA